MDLPRPTPPHIYTPRGASGFLPSTFHNVLPRFGVASNAVASASSRAAAAACPASGFSSPDVISAL